MKLRVAAPAPQSASGSGREPSSPVSAWLAVTVAATLLAWNLVAVATGRDFACFDDVARTLLARAWTRRPFWITPDVYWLPLPIVLRGAWAWPWCEPELLARPLPTFLIRLPGLALTWGSWRLLAGIARDMGGGGRAQALLACFFLANLGTWEFASSCMSEPDALFWLALATSLAARAGRGRCGAGGVRGDAEPAPGRFVPLGLALTAGCLVRYEIWTLAAGLGAWAAFESFVARRATGVEASGTGEWGPPRDRSLAGAFGPLAPLVLPALPALAWLWAGHARAGDALHFLHQGGSYVGALGSERLLERVAKSILLLQPLLAVPLILAGARELALRGTRAPAPLRVAAAVLVAWTIFKLWRIAPIPRYAWEPACVLAAAGAPALERAMDRLPATLRTPRASLALLAAAGAAAFGSFALSVARRPPYVSPEMRELSRAIRREVPLGNVLIRDHRLPADAETLETLRALDDAERFILLEWIERYGPPGPAHYRILHLRAVVARRAPEDTLLAKPPFATAGEWSAWLVDPYE